MIYRSIHEVQHKTRVKSRLRVFFISCQFTRANVPRQNDSVGLAFWYGLTSFMDRITCAIQPKWILLLSVIFSPSLSSAQVSRSEVWVDSVYSTMTLDQRIGQLFMIRAHSDLGPEHIQSVKDQISGYHVGGLCFFQGTPLGHAELINSYQVLSEIPLMVAIDAEWGGGMRFKENGFSFPRQLMLGAVQDNRLIYEMGKIIGRQLRDIGIHVNFAPVVDINNNPANPVIGDRSFGEDRYMVTAKAYQYMIGLQDDDVLPCAKHFPGHGDTDTDSHLDLPVITHSRARLDSVELFPFRSLISKGLPAVMVAHLQIPALDDRPNIPTTLSKYVVTDLLRNDLHFDGLIFTDALEMKGVTKYYLPGQVELKAFEAGNDMLVLPQDIKAAIDTLKLAFEDGRLNPADLEDHVKRILRYKYILGLTDVRNVIRPLNQIKDQVNDPEAIALKSALIENALTIVANKKKLIPVQKIDTLSVATLIIGTKSQGIFQKRIDDYVKAEHFTVEKSALYARHTALLSALDHKDLVLVAITGLSKKTEDNFGVTQEMIDFLKELNTKTDIIVVVFGSPYALKSFEDLPHLIMAYEEDPLVQDIAIQGIFGAFAMQGKLPVSVTERLPVGYGINSGTLMRLGYTIPERVGMSSDSLNRIAEIVKEMIKEKAAPGCQIVVARDGKVVYERAFGHFTYDTLREVQLSDLYDLASITKVAASTLSLMRLSNEGKINLNNTLGEFLPDVQGSNKADLRVNTLLAHQAGLIPWIPFYKETVKESADKSKPLKRYYRKRPSRKYEVPVANELYMRTGYEDTIWHRILDSELKSSGDYVYSDLAFFMFAKLIQAQTGKTIDQYCADQFYRPLGLTRLLYNPLTAFDISEIVPTEEDHYFRNQRLQGYVHDMGAAMLGGVSGHAGLFGNAHSLAVLMQMLMNGGLYGGTRYFAAETVGLFTSRVQGSTRRALGFDMKELDPTKRNLTSPFASDATYGHTGFTGTCVWNDPVSGLVFVFLSNRTYPSMDNNKLINGEYRQRVHTAIYKAMRN
ncbi:MAG TPA: glycoside hydrolase family 3 N-terminal domain-containing protein [Saprospiraceae bacterium]|nr:glycoside hydrolase family 3 N-terminal domain-containing protein [Saprospiraceae bacterium]